MTNNKKSKWLPGGKGIKVTPIIRGKRLALEFTTQAGAKAVFTMPQAKGGG